MLLAIDVGNTQTVIGLYKSGDESPRAPRPLAHRHRRRAHLRRVRRDVQ
ncbi:MAG: hypothetical protein V9G12_19795 [Microthrixaceae bacterium]